MRTERYCRVRTVVRYIVAGIVALAIAAVSSVSPWSWS